jgi:hypothetical protein
MLSKVQLVNTNRRTLSIKDNDYCVILYLNESTFR